MRLTQKKIEETIRSILGEEGLPLLKELSLRENLSEFDLAAKLKKDIKLIRKMLYLLYNHNLVSFTRKKDQIKGWYVYYWTILPESIKFNYYKTKNELLKKLKQQLENERKELFFACQNRCVRLTFDQAMDFEFRCPECGELAVQEGVEKRKEELRKQIADLEAELGEFKAVRRTQKVERKTRKSAVKKRVKQKKAQKRKRIVRK